MSVAWFGVRYVRHIKSDIAENVLCLKTWVTIERIDQYLGTCLTFPINALIGINILCVDLSSLISRKLIEVIAMYMDTVIIISLPTIGSIVSVMGG